MLLAKVNGGGGAGGTTAGDVEDEGGEGDKGDEESRSSESEVSGNGGTHRMSTKFWLTLGFGLELVLVFMLRYSWWR